MTRNIFLFAVTVRDYDEALAFYVGKLGFEKLEDTDPYGTVAVFEDLYGNRFDLVQWR